MPATPAQDLISESACFSCLGMSQFEAMQIALLDQISQNIAPAGETFFLLIQPGDILLVQPGDRFVYQ